MGNVKDGSWHVVCDPLQCSVEEDGDEPALYFCQVSSATTSPKGWSGEKKDATYVVFVRCEVV